MTRLIKYEFKDAPAALFALDKLARNIRTAPSFEALDTIARTSAAIQRAFKPIKEVADKAGRVWTEAETRKGRELQKIPKATGTRGQFIGRSKTEPPIDDAPTLAQLGVNRKDSARAQRLADIPEKKLNAVIDGLVDDGKAVTPNAVLAAIRQENKIKKKHAIAAAAFSATGPFDCVVIDPPWPMQKIDRDERPNQDAFDYPVMTEDELAAFWPAEIAGKLSPDCHVFCWTTQKFLSMTLRLVEDWGLHCILIMVWHKAGGFQPVGLPQYNCEFVVYARRGAPMFIDTKDFACCFEAPRREHSRKPDYFYDLIRRVTGGSRIDVFSREAREGFAQYGNETGKFFEAAE